VTTIDVREITDARCEMSQKKRKSQNNTGERDVGSRLV